MDYPKTVDEIAEELRGTAKSLTEVVEYHEMDAAEDDKDFLAALDSLVFCCEGCGWWCEISEMSQDEEHDWNCTDCFPDPDE